MDPEHKKIAEQLYQLSSFQLAETGVDVPVFVLIKNNKTIPILIPPGIDIDVAGYAMMSIHYASEQDADAIIVVAGMWVITGTPDQIDINQKPSESSEREHYLNLIYMSADGTVLESIAGKVETDPAGTKYVRHHDWLESIQQFEYLQPWR